MTPPESSKISKSSDTKLGFVQAMSTGKSTNVLQYSNQFTVLPQSNPDPKDHSKVVSGGLAWRSLGLTLSPHWKPNASRLSSYVTSLWEHRSSLPVVECQFHNVSLPKPMHTDSGVAIYGLILKRICLQPAQCRAPNRLKRTISKAHFM